MKHDDNMWKYYEKYTQRRVEAPTAHLVVECGPQPTCEHKQPKRYLATDDGFREVIVAGGEQTPETREKISSVMDSLKALLLEKNRRYGDSALRPLGIFTHHAADAKAGILWRLDDKLSRVAHSDELRRNDVCDIMGYLCLLCVDKGWTDFSGELD